MGLIVQKSDEQGKPWPEGVNFFYRIGKNGLFICRDHRFFQSVARASHFPMELGEVESYLMPRYPKIPRIWFEKVVGFFDDIAKDGAESCVLLYWDTKEEKLKILIPKQTVGTSTMSLKYDIPNTPPEWLKIGDIHCHVTFGAKASGIDTADELHGAGMHIIVGKIDDEPPEVHAEAVVEGKRFELHLGDVIEGYKKRRFDFPAAWIHQVTLDHGTPFRRNSLGFHDAYSGDSFRSKKRGKKNNKGGQLNLGMGKSAFEEAIDEIEEEEERSKIEYWEGGFWV